MNLPDETSFKMKHSFKYRGRPLEGAVTMQPQTADPDFAPPVILISMLVL